jgi:hypothetical protein
VSAFRFIPPCSPVTAKSVPTGDGWMHEVKFDGYRVQAHKIGRRVVLFSRYAEYTIMWSAPSLHLRPALFFNSLARCFHLLTPHNSASPSLSR